MSCNFSFIAQEFVTMNNLPPYVHPTDRAVVQTWTYVTQENRTPQFKVGLNRNHEWVTLTILHFSLISDWVNGGGFPIDSAIGAALGTKEMYMRAGDITRTREGCTITDDAFLYAVKEGYLKRSREVNKIGKGLIREARR